MKKFYYKYIIVSSNPFESTEAIEADTLMEASEKLFEKYCIINTLTDNFYPIALTGAGVMKNGEVVHFGYDFIEKENYLAFHIDEDEYNRLVELEKIEEGLA